MLINSSSAATAATKYAVIIVSQMKRLVEKRISHLLLRFFKEESLP